MRPRSYTVRIEWVRLVIAWVMISNRLVDMFCAQLVGVIQTHFEDQQHCSMLNAPRACLCKGPKPALHDATCTSLDWGRLENLMTKEDYKKTVARR